MLTGVDDGLPITPPRSPMRDRRIRQRRWAFGLAIALTLGLVGWAAATVLPHSCRWLDFDLTRIDGQCVGVSDGDFAFAPELVDVTRLIAAENRWVREQGAADLNGRKAYVSVAVLMPMTTASGSPLSGPQILVSLEGAYTAQFRANHSHDIRDPAPLIQLLVANEGSHQAQWSTAVDTLTSDTDPDHPVLAVVGLGVSLPATQQAASRLNERGVPMVGAVLAATNLTADRLFEAGASTLDYAKALRDYAEHLTIVDRPWVLVYDGSDDNFTATLKAGFDQEFRPSIVDRESFRGQANPGGATPDVFAPAVQNICLARSKDVLFAGRFKDLEQFAGALAARSCLSDGPVSVYTASTGLSTLFTQPFRQVLVDGRIRIHYASNTNAPAWSAGRGGRATGYENFRRVFVDQLHFPDTDLANGYSIMHHDAMMCAIWAIRLAPLGPTGIPTREDAFQMMKALHGANAIPAASGTLSFSDGTGWPAGKLVPIQQYPPDPADVEQTVPYRTDGTSP